MSAPPDGRKQYRARARGTNLKVQSNKMLVIIRDATILGKVLEGLLVEEWE
jgi:hypothetical protein